MTGARRDWVMAACDCQAGSGRGLPVRRRGGGVQGRRPDVRAGAARPAARQRQPQVRSRTCAVSLRARYAAVTPGYHLNKRHWNTVTLDGSVPDEEVLELIEHSYDLVVARLTKAQRDQLIT